MEIKIENYYEYVNKENIEKYLVCNICDKPLIEPVITPCAYTFCRRCIEKSLDDHCARCSSYTKSKHLVALTDPHILIELDNIQVKCKLCEQMDIRRGYFQNHIYQLCPKAIITCSNNENNCSWIGLREELSNHLTTCSYQSSTLDSQKEKHGKFFSCLNIDLQQRNLQNHDVAIAVKALLINQRCTCLDLFNKKISSESASIIASVLDNDILLEILSFRNNLLCDSGVQFIAHALSTNFHLQLLDLNNNSITDIGVRLIAEMLKTNQNLIKLTLSYNRISNEGMTILVDVLINNNSTLRWLSLAGNSSINDLSTHSITNLLRHNTSLTTLNLEDCNLAWWSKKQLYFYQKMYFKSAIDLLL
ncbi:unnamed protein product [Adineta steineri]|uniref:RING-type domain-containing protein n=1 Tax=Adineta steineri TaxID=433720 RepID=A0A819H9S7_9BILA|nr:unnamed protein product [Adineta steineri]CAF3896476.1 unnamed protein product [Adineta steineri]